MNGRKRSLLSLLSLLKVTLTACFTLIVLSVALSVFGVVDTAKADGIIIPEPIPCPDCPPLPPIGQIPYLTVKYHRVTVTIEDQVATTRIDQVFVNDTEWGIEGTYIFPLPETAAISEFSMWVEGEKVEGKLYEKEEARRIYEEIVRRNIDPALLEYVGRDMFQASIFPIAPGDERRVELEYSEVLPADGGLISYVYPLNTERFSARPLEDASISIDVESKDPIKAIYSSSHKVVVDRDGDYRAKVGWEDYNVRPDTDFVLYYTVSEEDMGVNLLSYKERDEDGFFMLLVAPNVDVKEEQVISKDVIIVLDTSGSMEGEKMEQAKDALDFVLDNLNDEDRFNIISFSTGIHAFEDGPVSVSETGEARRFVRNLEAGGGTDINRALLEALGGADKERPTILIFLTDGLPTEGVVEIDRILDNVDQNSRGNVRIFPFGVGDDVNTLLLDRMAQNQRGASEYVRPGERIDEKVSIFYSKVSTPILADVELDVEGIRVDDIYPYPLPDVFAGTQLVVVGRYRDGGAAEITLSGEVNGKKKSYTYDDLTFRSGGGDEFIARLWATRKIGHNLNQIRLHGENAELVDEIVKLSIRYGIITPYTSFLVEETEHVISSEGREVIVEKEMETYAAPPAANGLGGGVGSDAVDESVMQKALEEAEAPVVEATMDAEPVYRGEEAQPTVKTVRDKAFVYHEGTWIDTTFDSDTMETQKLSFGSDAFFEFLAAYPDAGRYFALGERVIVVLEGVAYETVEGEVKDGEATPPAQPDEDEGPGIGTDEGKEGAAGSAVSASSGGGICKGAGMVLVSALGLAAFRRV